MTFIVVVSIGVVIPAAAFDSISTAQHNNTAVTVASVRHFGNNMSRNLRKKGKVDYKKLNSGGREWEEQDMEEMVCINTDQQGERDLCGSFTQEEELDYDEYLSQGESEEDGEIVSSEQSEEEDEETSGEEDPEIQKCMKTGDINKLKAILKAKEDRCKKLRREVAREKQREKKDKEMQEILGKIGKANKAQRSLQRSLASTRNNSPRESPKLGKKTQKHGFKSE